MRVRWMVLGACAGALLAAGAAWACPGCADALAEPAQVAQKVSAAKGYNASIALFLLVPFGLIGGFTLTIARASRQRARSPRQPG